MPNESIDTSLKETKHKISPLCLNKCIKWKLQAKVNAKETPSEIEGVSSYFQKLDASVLNILQNNNLNYSSTLKNLTENSSNELKNITSPNLLEIMKIKLPIDNTSFNFMIIDANLGIKDNLNNLFFLEFDLNNENGNKIRNINDDIVEKEINFTLNGYLHEQPLFKSDLVFSVEYRKFIKSIQFRLQNYKNQMLNKKKYGNKHNRNGNQYRNSVDGKKNVGFYAKILSNINIGIEFTRNQLDEYEFFHTNFNSIVNSNIKINKIYLEVCIPKIFIEGKNINLGKMKVASSQSTNTTTQETHSSPTSTSYQNDFDRMLYKQHNSPSLSLRSNLSLNNRYHYTSNPSSFYNSPPITIKPLQNLNPPHILYSPMLAQGGFFAPYPPSYINQGTSQRKFSENVYDKIKENPLSKMNHQIPQIFPSSQTPVIMRMNNEDFVSGIPVQPFISPRGIPHPRGMNMTHGGYMPMGNPMVQTIHKKIIDWENKNDSNEKKTVNEKGNTYKKEFIDVFNGKSNLELFMNDVTPCIDRNSKDNLNMKKLFEGFVKSSLFGIRITYYTVKDLKNIIYSLTLSSMEISINKKEIIDAIISHLTSIKKITQEQVNTNDVLFINDLMLNLSVKLSHSEVIISYYENKPFHFRQTLIKTLNALIKALPLLADINLKDLSDSSYIAILYTPLKLIKNITSFIVYYRFNTISPQNEKYSKLECVGLLPIKFDTKFFFTKISVNNFLQSKDMLLLNTYISNVLEKIIKCSISTSYDYEIYLKTNSELLYPMS